MEKNNLVSLTQEVNKTICAYPWHSAAIRPNGIVIPCCRFPHEIGNESNLQHIDPRNSNSWVTLRNNMLNGIKSEGCKSCYQDESNGLLSMRQQSLQKFIPNSKEIIPVRQLEVSFSNLCNLACVHCSSFFSSKWYSEDVKFARIGKSGVLKNDFNFSKWDLSKVNELKIIGGEPFMEQQKFVDLMKNLNLSTINLQICTNGTITPSEELKCLIEQCKNVYLCISLDGIGTTNDWYRWPSKFDEVINNMKTFENWWEEKKNIYFIVHHVINAINIFELKKFIEYMEIEFPNWRIEWDWIRWPHWQELSVFKNSIKVNLINELDNLNRQYQEKDENLRPNPYKISIERILENPNSSFDVFKKEVLQLSKERNLDFFEMVSKFKTIW